MLNVDLGCLDDGGGGGVNGGGGVVGERLVQALAHSGAYLSTTTNALSSKMTWCRFFSPCSVTQFIVCS